MVKACRSVQIVLAAGRSERMGSPKPLLDFGGRTALELVVGAAVDAGVASTCIVIGESGDAVQAAHGANPCFGRARWVHNRERGSEQVRSLQLALEALKDEQLDAFFIHPVDHPLATASDYSLLLRAFEADSGAHEAFILSHGHRRGHPILCRTALSERFLALGPDQTARAVIEQTRLSYVLTPNSGVLEDMDRPEDYVRAKARLGQG